MIHLSGMSLCHENYIKQGMKHIEKDNPIGWSEVKEISRRVKKHCRALHNVFRQSPDWGEQEETIIKNVMVEEAIIIPQLNLTQKDHKQYEGDVPPTSPICTAGSTINQRVSDLTADILQSLFKAEDSVEASSTEDFLHRVEQINNNILAGDI